MGNISGRRVLPKGAVCDPCNNYFASKVEGPVLGHISFQNLRAKYMVPTKRGKTPSVKGFAHNTDIEVGMRLDKKTNRLEFFAIKESQAAEFERLKGLDAMFVRQELLVFPMEVDPPQKEMSRFLAKMAFEALFERFCNTVSVRKQRTKSFLANITTGFVNGLNMATILMNGHTTIEPTSPKRR